MPAILLVDELDRADDDFEAFLFEMLAESSVTIPEIGTIRATHPPAVILTSNRTRDLHDALKRRCLYHWIDYPSPSARWRSSADACRERLRSWRARPPRRSAGCARAMCRSRRGSPRRSTGSLPWSSCGVDHLDASAAERTLGSVLKYRDDQEQIIEQGLDWLVGSDAGGR